MVLIVVLMMLTFVGDDVDPYAADVDVCCDVGGDWGVYCVCAGVYVYGGVCDVDVEVGGVSDAVDVGVGDCCDAGCDVDCVGVDDRTC